MKQRLRLPASLAVVALSGATTVAAVASTLASCGGDDAPQDAQNSCSVFCFEGITDAGPPPDGGCPLCADFSSGVPVCPSGCTPLG